MPSAAAPKRALVIEADTVRDKAVAQASMGVVSALLAGFDLTVLEGIDISKNSASNVFVISAALSLGLSVLVVIESTLEYMFVTRELVHGAQSAWELMQSFRPYRRLAEIGFACSVLLWPVTTAIMLEERFRALQSTGTTVSQVLLGMLLVVTLVVMIGMQKRKKQHQGDRFIPDSALSA